MPGKVVDREAWLNARRELLVKEKEHTRMGDKLASLRSEMPMVKITEVYDFTSLEGKKLTLTDLFGGRKQLMTYHFMFDPSWEAGCTGCSFLADNVPVELSHLQARDTTFVFVSRAPIEKLKAFQKRMGWEHIPWYSSESSQFNNDFYATQDEDVRPVMYNFDDKTTLEKKGWKEWTKGEQPGLSVFWKDGEEVFHTYSTYARGPEHLLMIPGLLALTPLGKQDEGMKGGKPFKYHDLYTVDDLKGSA